MASGTCIIIGLGNIGIQLLRMLSKDLNLICIDSNRETLDWVKQLRGENLMTMTGDATSRLVLDQAGVSEADTVIITTTSETINIEVARILKEHFDIPRVVSVGITKKGIDELEALDVEVESIFNLSATGLRNRVEHKTKAVHGIGLGKNEILEVEVHAHSRLAHKPLAALNPKSWRLGIIYRDGNLIIPRGDTVLRAKDKVIILGEPKVLKTVADLLTFRFTHFPLEFGDTLAVYLGHGEPQQVIDEVDYLLSVFPLEKALFMADRASEDLKERLETLSTHHHLSSLHLTESGPLDRTDALRSALQERSLRPALMVVPRSSVIPALPLPHAGQRGKHLLQEFSDTFGCPLLLAAGSYPYQKVALPCLRKEGLQQAIETTLEMSASINYQIEALFVSLSRYISSSEEALQQEEMRKLITDLGVVYRSTVRPVELSGNPIRAVSSALQERHLMVMDISSWKQQNLFRAIMQPDVPWQIVQRSPISTLLIPSLRMIG